MNTKPVDTMTAEELSAELYALQQLERTLTETIRAADNCETWSYYGRSSREELPGVQSRIYELQRRLRANS